MSSYSRIILQACVLLLCGLQGLAAETVSVGRNPFARPARAAEPQAGVESPGAGAPMFSLRATMAAGAESLVNIEGNILQLGDVFAGYKLIAVGEGTAVFARNGVRYPVAISQRSGDEG